MLLEKSIYWANADSQGNSRILWVEGIVVTVDLKWRNLMLTSTLPLSLSVSNMFSLHDKCEMKGTMAIIIEMLLALMKKMEKE